MFMDNSLKVVESAIETLREVKREELEEDAHDKARLNWMNQSFNNYLNSFDR